MLRHLITRLAGVTWQCTECGATFPSLDALLAQLLTTVRPDRHAGSTRRS